jgi:hypothetical protein
MTYSEYWGVEGVLRCCVCNYEVKCHSLTWGSSSTTGYCNNCGSQGRTMSWYEAEWGAPQHNVLEPEFGKPRVN